MIEPPAADPTYQNAICSVGNLTCSSYGKTVALMHYTSSSERSCHGYQTSLFPHTARHPHCSSRARGQCKVSSYVVGKLFKLSYRSVFQKHCDKHVASCLEPPKLHCMYNKLGVIAQALIDGKHRLVCIGHYMVSAAIETVFVTAASVACASAWAGEAVIKTASNL